MTNSADPDQLASSEANWSGSTLFAKTGHVVFSKRRVKYNNSFIMYVISFNLQIYVEIERARLTRTLAKIKEDAGKITEAAEILQELQVRLLTSHL